MKKEKPDFIYDDVDVSHQEQQAAAERILEMIAQGVPSKDAISKVADELRAKHKKDLK